MELLLNAIWLAVATALVVVWRVRWLPQLRACSADRRKWQSFAGLVCVLALLFPAISLTDDLHPAEFALADTKSLCSVAAQGHLSAVPLPRHHSPARSFSGIIPASQFRLLFLPDESSVGCTTGFALRGSGCRQISDRAPPSLS